MRKQDLPPATPEARAPRLTALRRAKMARSAHAYVRGSTVKFYEWLDRSDRVALPDGPPVWICGDCHLGNLGPIASAEGKLEIGIRDLDQTVIGNPAHDLARLALSLAMAARSSDLPGVTTAHMVELLTEGYENALAGDAPEEFGDMPKPVRGALARAAKRSWKHLADERIEGVEPVIPLGKRFWPLTDAERAATETLFRAETLRGLVTGLRGRPADAAVRLLDAAYWRKGCSSLGRLRLAALVEIRAGKDVSHCLMDVKEAVTAAAPRAAGARMPQDQGSRVVTGAQALSPFLGDRMASVSLLGHSGFVRELLPQDLKLELEALSTEEAKEVAFYLAGVVGRAHARQMDKATRKAWHQALVAGRTKGIDAPAWLWRSVVELVGIHESAYLEHCRMFALGAG